MIVTDYEGFIVENHLNNLHVRILSYLKGWVRLGMLRVMIVCV